MTASFSYYSLVHENLLWLIFMDILTAWNRYYQIGYAWRYEGILLQ